MTDRQNRSGRWTWRLLQENCTGCGICADVCKEGAVLMPRETAYPRAIPGKCTGCGTCLQECPFDAIRVEIQD